MSKEEKQRQLATRIITTVGGKENVIQVAHCITRLRFYVKDKSRIDLQQLQALDGVVGTQWQGEQFQIVIGQDVADVYREVSAQLGMDVKEQLSENLDTTKKGRVTLAAFFDGISGAITPLLPILIGGGMIKVILMLAIQFSLIGKTNQTYVVLSFATDAVFYFLPVFIGATGARKFGANMGLGMLLGSILVFPGFVSAIAEGTSLSIFSLPIYATTYGKSVFPMIMTTFVLAIVEKTITRFSPKIVRSILVPFLALLIMIPLMLVVIAPIGDIIGTYLATAIFWLYDTTGFISVGILSAVFAILVMTGTQHALLPVVFTVMAASGFEPMIIFANTLYTINQGVVTLAVGIKEKNPEVKSTAFAATVSSFVAGISEPALFGFTLKNKVLLVSSMVGCFFGGLYGGITGVGIYQLPGSVGFLVAPAFYNGNTWSILNFFIAVFIACAITFAGCYFIALKKNKEVN